MNIGFYATMASAPERPQPLHNFFLSQLRWGHNSTANHRFRRRDSNRHRSVSDGGSDSDLPPPAGSQPRFSPEKERPPTPREEESQRAERNGGVVIPEEGETRTWNLRPRKASVTRSGEMAEVEKSHSHSHMPKSQRLRGIVEGVAQGQGQGQGHQWVEKKRKLWISLSKEEIEEDVYSLTGSRPARRPKKRPRNVQKLVNNVLPGLYLAGLSVDSYRAHESQTM
ncbi:PREDICTED: uncharacterized protein LOC109161601 isoform X2 [Ipomoea nil]|uniref:uncharacterized protein LOC109161601 isoform X2 n=1 Tax=Ipomoea nil TaxID=35883 RepID=UPI000900D6FD|nr:PREDICTED: uncharacterized protein LOC109161601 isoform X2 [Ipomoea nil]